MSGSLWTYAALFLLPLLWTGVRRAAPAHEPAAVATTALALAVFIGLRHQVGGDWNSYWLLLERARASSAGTAMLLSEPSYMAANLLAARLGLGIGVVNLACGAVLATGIVAFCRRQPSPPLALLVAMPVLVAVVGLNATRQATAVGLELWALSLLLGGTRIGRPALLLLFACTFHWSAAVLLPLIALFGLRPQLSNPVLASLAVLACLAVALLWALGSGDGGTPSGGAFRLAPSLVAAVLVATLRKRLELGDAGHSIAIFLAILTAAALALLPVHPIAGDRLGYYTIPLQMLVLSRAGAALPGPALRRAFEAGLMLLFPAMLALWFARSPYAPCVLPYRSYLAQPQLLLPGAREGPRLMCLMVVTEADRRAARL